MREVAFEGTGQAVCDAYLVADPAVAGERLRIDREQYEEIVLAKRIDERAFAQFQAHGDRLTGEALLQTQSPSLNGLGAVGDEAGPGTIKARAEQADVVFGIGPVNAYEGGEPMID